MTEPLRILILTANPVNTTRLALESEYRLLRNKMRDNVEAGNCELMFELAARPTDLQMALARVKPHVVHFAGHGTSDGICLEDDCGASVPISKEQLALLFTSSLNRLRLIVLNACFSAVQAEHLARSVDYLVGTKTAVTDEAALKFAADFYHALAVGKTVRDAFYEGASPGEQDHTGQYQLHVRSGIDESKPLVPSFVGNAVRVTTGRMKAEETIEVANLWFEGTDASPLGDQAPSERNEAVVQSDSAEAKTIRIANKIIKRS